MDCKYFQELLSVYIDGYANEKEKNSLEKHLSICKDCNEYFQKLKNYKNNLGKFEKIEAPFGFEKRVMQKIEEKEKPFGLFFTKKLILEFSAIVLVLISVFFVYLNISRLEKEKAKEIISEDKILQKKKLEDKSKVSTLKIEKFEEKKEVKEAKKAQKMEKNKLDLKKEEVKKKEKMKIEKDKIPMPPMDYTMESPKEEDKKQDVMIKEIEAEKKAPPRREEKEEQFLREFKEEMAIVAESPIVHIEKRLKIEIVYDMFDEIIERIEETLKNENIKYNKRQINEKLVEISISKKDLNVFIEKISKIEGLKIKDYKMKEISESKQITIEISISD